MVLFGEILKLRNVHTSFDEFADDDSLTPRDLQNYTSTYNTLWEKHRKRGAQVEKESFLDDVVFEIELVKQVEVNIDYILMLVMRWREAKAVRHGARQSSRRHRERHRLPVRRSATSTT